MNTPLGLSEFQSLREFIHQRSGIQLGDDKAYLVEHRLARLLPLHNCRSYGELYHKAKSASAHSDLCQDILDAISTNETSWFRDPRLFSVLKEKLLPQMLGQIQQGDRADIRIWSAACSSGQEPYSLAMTAQDFWRAHGGEPVCRQQVRILATDLSRHALATAQRGLYSEMELARGLPPGYRQRFFLKEQGGWQVRPELKDLVEFRRQNLRDPLANLGKFDIIALRNVIIYFSEEVKRELFGRLSGLLNPGGYLFLGTGETVGYYSRAFEVLEHHGLNMYRLAQRPGAKPAQAAPSQP